MENVRRGWRFCDFLGNRKSKRSLLLLEANSMSWKVIFARAWFCARSACFLALKRLLKWLARLLLIFLHPSGVCSDCIWWNLFPATKKPEPLRKRVLSTHSWDSGIPEFRKCESWSNATHPNCTKWIFAKSAEMGGQDWSLAQRFPPFPGICKTYFEVNLFYLKVGFEDFRKSWKTTRQTLILDPQFSGFCENLFKT